MKKKLKIYIKNIKLFYGLIKDYKIWLIGILGLIILNSILESIGIGLLIPILDLISGNQTNNVIVNKIRYFFELIGLSLNLKTILGVFFGLIVIKSGAKFIESLCFFKFRMRLGFDIATKIFNNLMNVAYSYFHNTKKGDVLFTITGTSGSIGAIILHLNQMLIHLTLLLAYLTMLFLISVKLTFITLILSVLVLPIIKKLLNLTKEFSHKYTKAAKQMNSIFVELIDGIQIIKAFAREQYAKNKFSEIYWDSSVKGNKVRINTAFITVTFQPITLAILIIIIFFGNYYLKLSFSSMIVFLFVVYKFIPYTQTLISELNLIFTQLPLVQIAIDAMSKKDKPYLKDGNKEIKNFKNKIELNNVNFSYLKGVPVLKNLNTSIEKNKITAIIGATGSGKSSLVNLLLRFYDVDSGNISIDGTDLKDLKNKSWLDIISYVPQDVFLFNLSVKENIRFGNLQATDKDVIIAAKTANAHDFISGLPEGYDTIIGERGVKVSGGQKQMIALARALIRQPQILILDEATSSLDNESERLVQRAIDKISKNITIIAIAHRLSTITNADKIIVLEKGKIVEENNHTELIEESGHYEKFYNLQFQD